MTSTEKKFPSQNIFEIEGIVFSSNFDIRMSAARSIISHNTPASRALIDLIQETTFDENKLIISHVQNPLIKY